MSSAGINTWNLISGTIGVLTVLPFIWAFVRYQHPETKMAELDSTLKDTEALLRSVSEEGLLDPQRQVPHFTSHITQYRTKAEVFREETFIVSVSWRKALKAWSRGLSRRIATLSNQVKEIRAEICETSAERRMQLLNEDGDDAPSLWCVWRVRFVDIWECLVVSRGPAVETVEIASTASTAASVVTAVTASSEGMMSVSTCAETAVARDPSPSRPRPHAQSRMTSSTHCLDSDRTCCCMSSSATRHHHVRMLASAIRRVDRELAAQGVNNALLAQLAQATRKHWSPASAKANPPRPRKPRGSGSGCKNVAASRDAPGQSSINSDTYTSGEETACELI